jgi:hypothetical protein
MPRTTYRLRSITLTFNITDFGHAVSDADLARNLDQVIHDWHDGRHALPVETIHDSLAKLVKQAIGKAIAQEMRDRFGDRMVKSPNNGSGSVASILTARKCRDVSVLVANTVPSNAQVRTGGEQFYDDFPWESLIEDEVD